MPFVCINTGSLFRGEIGIMALSEKKMHAQKRKEDRGLFCPKLQVRRKLLALGLNSSSNPSRLFSKSGEGVVGVGVLGRRGFIRAVFTSF